MDYFVYNNVRFNLNDIVLLKYKSTIKYKVIFVKYICLILVTSDECYKYKHLVNIINYILVNNLFTSSLITGTDTAFPNCL